MSGPERRREPRSRHDWGWHRLTVEWADRIVRGAGVRPGDLVLDLGAGTGALTAPLLRAGASVLAIELDDGRAASLRRRFAGRDVTVVQTDLTGLRLPRRPFRVVSSPPYAGASALVRLLLSHDRMVAADLVLQAGAARRLVAQPPGRHSGGYQLTIGRAIPRRAFVPSPAVDSVLLRIRQW